MNRSRHGRSRRGTSGRGWNPLAQSTPRGFKEPNQFPDMNANGPIDNMKFKDACAKIQKNIEKHMNNGVAFEPSSSEDELESTEIIEKTFKDYNISGISSLDKTRDVLQESLTSGAVVCLICIESIKRTDPIWSCNNCYGMLHVSCIKKWAKDSMFHQNSMGDHREKKESKWCCPKCRHEYAAKDVPSQYLCFCGKMEDPPYDIWLVPHSCGETCRQPLIPLCGHECLLLCHPGVCPPCPKVISVSCHCGRSTPTMKRCCYKKWSCGKACDKLLSCNHHNCQEPCHEGDCPPCSLQSLQKCVCGAEEQLRPCDDRSWKCQKRCRQVLPCGHHLCKVECHAGVCPPCPKSGPRPCPCGKKVESLPCTEEISTCGDTCEKLIECGIHKCIQMCHFGPCENCLQMRMMRCRCGQRLKSVPCCKEFLCDIKCKNKRDCGKHNCNRKCCIGNCPPCEAPCSKTLNCGSHKCASRCHAGPCFPCRESAEIKCNCGQTRISIPCGRRRAAVPPQCTANCKLPSNCHHDERHQHRCHFGDCPPCRKVCAKALPCSHTCPAKCHTSVLTKVQVKKREGPWDLQDAFKMQLIEKPCPPCKVPIRISCRGEHVIQDFPCHEGRSWSCGRSCGRQLKCGNHQCQKECHEYSDLNLDDTENCVQCEKGCEKERPIDCPHACHKPCHPNECDPCNEFVKKQCHCQLMTKYILCQEWALADEHQREELLCCQSNCPKQLSCGHRCTQLCHSGDCPDRSACKKKVTIRCPCKRLKKEASCPSNTTLECDSFCQESLERLEAEKAALRKQELEEEKLKLDKELEEYNRKMEGRKRKSKKQKEIVQKKSLLKNPVAIGLIVIVGILIAVIVAFFTPISLFLELQGYTNLNLE